MIQLKEEEIAALRACMEVAHPSEDDKEPLELWTIADRALKMIEAQNGSTIGKTATDDTSPKYLVQIDLFNIYCAAPISPEGLKTSMASMLAAAVLNEIKIIHQREVGRPLAQPEALGMVRNIRNAIHITRVR